MKNLLVAILLVFSTSVFADDLSLNCETQHYVLEQIITHLKFMGESVPYILNNYPFPDEWNEMDRIWAVDVMKVVNELPKETNWPEYVANQKCVSSS